MCWLCIYAIIFHAAEPRNKPTGITDNLYELSVLKKIISFDIYSATAYMYNRTRIRLLTYNLECL